MSGLCKVDCLHRIGTGSCDIVYVDTGCPHAGLCRGVLICTEHDCRPCLHKEVRAVDGRGETAEGMQEM